MKRKLEADLISIAHRILQLKNKSDINQLYLETQKLYEKLAVLRFIDEHFSEAKPTIGFAEISSKIESIFDKQDTISEPSIEIKETVIEETETKNGIAEEISENVSEEIEEVMPVSEQQELNELQTEEQPQETAIEEILSEENKLTNIEEVASETLDEIVEDSEIPEDRTFRDAWIVDETALTDGVGE